MNKQYINELKADTTSALMIEENKAEQYRIKILHRGEQLFYYDKKINKALIIEIQVRNGSIFKTSINKWDDGVTINEAEKTTITDRLINYFKTFQKIDATIR